MKKNPPLTTAYIMQLVREDNLIKFYKHWQWIGVDGVRHKVMKKHNYECQACKRRGRYRKAKNVHHIKPVKEYPQIEWSLNENNLEAVCIQCHNELDEKHLIKKDKKKSYMNEERW